MLALPGRRCKPCYHSAYSSSAGSKGFKKTTVNTSICLNCHKLDSGSYCSSCRAPLQVAPNRIPEIVAARMVSEGGTDAAAPSHTVAPQSTWPTLVQISALFPFSVVLTDAIPGTHSNMMTIVGTTAVAHVNDTLHRTLDGLFGQLVGWKGEIKGVARVQFEILVVFEDGYFSDDLKRLRRHNRRSWSMGFNVTLKYVCLDVPKKKVSVPWWAFNAVAVNARSALDQVAMVRPTQQTHGAQSSWDFGTVAGVAFMPFVDFMEGLKLLFRPRLAAQRIANGDFKIADALRYAIGSIVITALLEQVTRSQSGLFRLTGLPVIDELVAAIILGAVALGTAALFYVCIRLAGGKGKFRYAFYATLLVNLAFLPVGTILEGILGSAAKGATQGASLTSAIYLSALFGPLYGISPKRAFWFTQAGLWLLVIGAVTIAVMLF